MAQITNKQDLKAQAIQTLAEGREEISAEVDRLRQQLSPAHVVKRVVERHAGLLVALTVTASLIPALLLFRGKRPPLQISLAQPPPTPVFRTLLLGSVGLLARLVTPAVIKSFIAPHLQDYMAKKNPGADASTPQV